jgi:hypothetical protein
MAKHDIYSDRAIKRRSARNAHRSRGTPRSGNAESPGSRSPVWFFGALRLGNQTFDLQNLRDTQHNPAVIAENLPVNSALDDRF